VRKCLRVCVCVCVCVVILIIPSNITMCVYYPITIDCVCVSVILPLSWRLQQLNAIVVVDR
jgi:hypothetical protein